MVFPSSLISFSEGAVWANFIFTMPVHHWWWMVMVKIKCLYKWTLFSPSRNFKNHTASIHHRPVICLLERLVLELASLSCFFNNWQTERAGQIGAYLLCFNVALKMSVRLYVTYVRTHARTGHNQSRVKFCSLTLRACVRTYVRSKLDTT